MKPASIVREGSVRRAGVGFVGVALLLALVACDNMKHQRNLRMDAPTDLFPNGTTAQQPPPGTVARDAPMEFVTPATTVAAAPAAGALPVPLTAALLARGRERFEAYCAPCHGSDGYGTGIVVRRGFPAPPSYHEERLRRAPLGHFYDVITHGYGVMYSYAERVSPSDRWAVAAYIRALQRSQHATLADVPPAQRSALAAP
jgi:mono/diheme cytochrome c family protein